MKDFIDVGSSPPGENCAQVGSEGYWPRAKRECRAYIGLLRRTFGDEPNGARLAIKENPHDFGTYLSVVVHYDDQFPESVEYAFHCESGGPEAWDAAARQELALERR